MFNQLFRSCVGIGELKKFITVKKMGIATSPFFTGKKSRSCSSAVHMWPSVVAGMNMVSTVASNCVRGCLMLGIALMWYGSLCWKPLTNAAQVTCGSLLAIFDSTHSWLYHGFTLQFLGVFTASIFTSNKATKVFLLSVLMLILVPLKISRAFVSTCGFTISHDFDAFGLYPNLGPQITMLSH